MTVYIRAIRKYLSELGYRTILSSRCGGILVYKIERNSQNIPATIQHFANVKIAEDEILVTSRNIIENNLITNIHTTLELSDPSSFDKLAEIMHLSSNVG